MDPRLEGLAAHQGGVVTRRQLLDLGFSDKRLYRMVRTGEFARVAGGRYRVRETVSWVEQVSAAQVLVGRNAVAARGCAARLQGIEGAPTSAEIVFYVEPTAGVVRRPGLRLVRRVIDASAVDVSGEIPCTVPLLTVVDCARFLPHASGVAVIEGAIRRGLVTLDEVEAAIAQLRYVTGAPAARRAVSRVDPLSQSVLETEARLLLLDAGIEVVAQAELGRWHADLAVLAARLAIELQGATHRTKEQQQEDETRRSSFLSSGWEVVGFTAYDVRSRPGYVVAVVQRLIRLRAAR